MVILFYIRILSRYSQSKAHKYFSENLYSFLAECILRIFLFSISCNY
jgi:hypothetical protein